MRVTVMPPHALQRRHRVAVAIDAPRGRRRCIESRSQMQKAGKILVEENPTIAELIEATDLANRWRACHAYPINTFQSTLRNKLRAFSGTVLFAQRLKRMQTIIDKLKRFPAPRVRESAACACSEPSYTRGANETRDDRVRVSDC